MYISQHPSIIFTRWRHSLQILTRFSSWASAPRPLWWCQSPLQLIHKRLAAVPGALIGWAGATGSSAVPADWLSFSLCAGSWRLGCILNGLVLEGEGVHGQHSNKGARMVLVHVGYLVLPVFGSVRSRGNCVLFTVARTLVWF